MEAAPETPMQVLGVQRGRSQPADPSVKRGSVFHEHFEGDSAVAFLNDGHLALRVWCKEDAGTTDGAMVLDEVPYGYKALMVVKTEPEQD